MIHVPHKIIYNAYKYDIKQASKMFVLHNENIPDNVKEKFKTLPKSEYTKQWGNLVKQNKRLYDEFIQSLDDYFFELIMKNQKYYSDKIKILKCYIDEIVVNKPLYFKQVTSKYKYKTSELKFIVNVFKLNGIGKQLYISNKEGVKFRNPFQTSYIIDVLNNIWRSNSECFMFLDRILKGTIKPSNLVDINGTLLDSSNILRKGITLETAGLYGYNKIHYYKLIQEICKYICIAKDLQKRTL